MKKILNLLGSLLSVFRPKEFPVPEGLIDELATHGISAIQRERGVEVILQTKSGGYRGYLIVAGKRSLNILRYILEGKGDELHWQFNQKIPASPHGLIAFFTERTKKGYHSAKRKLPEIS